jgi:hypothetical protein
MENKYAGQVYIMEGVTSTISVCPHLPLEFYREPE